jgi:FMN phosphatase YigB (HAD superfamily)
MTTGDARSAAASEDGGMTTITAVTFDCWGTLITDSGFEKAMARRGEAISAAFGIPFEEAAELMDRAWREHHNAWINGVQYGSAGIARFCMTDRAVDDEGACAALQEALEEAGRLGTQRALKGAVNSLKTLRAAGIRTALVCDAGFTPGRIVRDFLDEYGLLEHLEYCAFSDEVGVPKPDPRIFRAALEALEVAPEETVHVGDLLRTDIHGGKQLGMRTVRITQVSDDAVRGFSWDPNAAFASTGTEPPPDGAPVSPFEDADAVVASHAELPDALRALGAQIPTG